MDNHVRQLPRLQDILRFLPNMCAVFKDRMIRFRSTMAVFLSSILQACTHRISNGICIFVVLRKAPVLWDFIARRTNTSSQTCRNLVLLRLRSIYEPRLLETIRAARHNTSDSMAFEVEWTTYVRGFLKEWKLMNASNCLMLSTVVGLLQFCDSGDSEVTNATGIISLVNALISLAFNTLYHNTMSSLSSAQRGRLWLQGATDVAESAWRNVPILLMVPLVWLIWSIASLIVFVLSCVWAGPISSGSNSPLAVQDPSSELPARGGTNYPVPTLGACISITCMLIIGLMHLVVVVSEFRKLGTSRSAAMLAESGDVNEEWRDMFS